MCKKNYDTIIQEIENHLKTSGRRYYSEFFIGTTHDAVFQLFEVHHVKQDGDWWIYRTAEDANTAQQILSHYIDLGMRHNQSGNHHSDNNEQVYCYAVTPTTTE